MSEKPQDPPEESDSNKPPKAPPATKDPSPEDANTTPGSLPLQSTS